MKTLNLLKPALCGAAMLLSFACYGQGIRNFLGINGLRNEQGLNSIPLGALPLQYNSSFVGESDGARFNTVLTYKNTVRPIFNDGIIFGSHASYDQFIPAFRAGIGISVNKGAHWHSTEIKGVSHNFVEQTNSVSLAIAPKFSIKGKYTLSPSIDFSYGRGSVDASQPDNNYFYFDQYRGKHAWLESRLGLLFNTNKYYIGYTAYLLNQHYHNNEPSNYRLSKRISSVQAGYTFQRSADSKFSFTPQIVYIFNVLDYPRHEKYYFQTVAFNFTFRYDKYLAGINNTGLHLGWQTEKLRIMVSNHPTLGGHWNIFSNGNVSLRYLFKN